MPREAPKIVFVGRMCYDLHSFEKLPFYNNTSLGGDITHSVIAAKALFPNEQIGVVTSTPERFIGKHLFKGVEMRTTAREKMPEVRFRDFELVGAEKDDDEITVPSEFLGAKVISFGAVHPKNVGKVREQYGGKIVFTTKKSFLREIPGDVLEAMRHSDISIINEDEFGILGIRPEQLTSSGKSLIVTRGARGLSAYTSSGNIAVPAYPTKRGEAVGTGDAFKAVLSVSLARGEPFKESLAMASAAASFFAENPINREINSKELAERYNYILKRINGG